MPDGLSSIYTVIGLFALAAVIGSVLASWAWRAHRAARAGHAELDGAGFNPRAYAGGPAPGSYVPVASGLARPTHAEPQFTRQVVTSRPLPDELPAYGRHHAPDPPPSDWPPYRQ